VESVLEQLPPTIKLEDFYDYMVSFFASRIIHHPDYNILASRIEVDKLHMITSSDIKEVANKLYHNYDKENIHTPLIDLQVYNIIIEHYDQLTQMLDMSRDYLFDFFGIKTLERSYLIKNQRLKRIIERPQHMFMRVSIGIHKNNIGENLS